MNRMRFTEILREAARNLGTGTSRAGLGVLLMAITCLALVVLDTTTMSEVIAAANTFRERGGSILVLHAEKSIDGRACDALADLPGVRAAGALAASETPIRLAVLPQNPLTSYIASPGFATMLPNATGQQYGGLLLPVAVADDLGVRIGDSLHTTQGVTTVGGTYDYPDDGRPPGMGFAAIAPAPAEQVYDECWVDAYPVGVATTEMIYTALVADSASTDFDTRLSQHNVSMGAPGDPAAAFAGRTTAMFSVAGFVLGCLAGVAAVWLRRLDVASALHAGVHRRDQIAILGLETLTWATVGVICAIPAIAMLNDALADSDRIAVILTAMHTVTMTAAGAIAGTLLAALFVRERRLFTYFKAR